MPPFIAALPSIDAALNAASAVLLVGGYLCIRRRQILAHKLCMLSAVGVSALFLAGYLTRHFYAGLTRFPGQGWIRPLYFTILISHTILAVVVVPLVLVTLSLALLARFDRHVRIARWTFPIWTYVSITGVLVYWMLYHLVLRG